MPLHIAIAIASGILFLFYIRRLSIRGLMSMRYALGWFLIGISAIFLAPLIGLADFVADAIGTQTSVILLGIPMVVLCIVTVQLSISVSGLTERTRILAEEVAALRNASSENPISAPVENNNGSPSNHDHH